MSTQPRPDILLIVLDTLRADRLSCYGYSRETSPHIDASADSGVLFERAVSPAQWTILAYASLFTGEYPTTHVMTQIYDKHSKTQVTLAEVLYREGYHTVSFCSNVLLGVVENDLDRGLVEFYNYGGTLPNRLAIGDSRPRRLGRIAHRLSSVLRSLVTAIQDVFVRSNLFAAHRHASLGDSPLAGPRKLQGGHGSDAAGYGGLPAHSPVQSAERPLFGFINLMETHLPYVPHRRFIHSFVPYHGHNREARDFGQGDNLEYYRWLVPLVEPVTEPQDRVISDMYDAEVAYEDYLLRHLFDYLGEPEVRDNTLVIVTSDHGEGLNHHGFIGHSMFA